MTPGFEKPSIGLKKPTALLAAVALFTMMFTAAAYARQQYSTFDFYNGGHTAMFRAYGDSAGSLEAWDSFRTSESTPTGGTVCAYQSYLNENYPSSGTVFSQYSSLHSGCSYMLAYFDWPSWDSNYGSSVYFGGWWNSDTSPGGSWDEIGILQR